MLNLLAIYGKKTGLIIFAIRNPESLEVTAVVAFRSKPYFFKLCLDIICCQLFSLGARSSSFQVVISKISDVGFQVFHHGLVGFFELLCLQGSETKCK